MSARTWVNWARNQTARPTDIARPASVYDVVELVTRAAAQGRRVKPVGTGHSFTGIAVAPDIQVDMRRLSGITGLDTERRLVTLGAGTPLWRLSQLLTELGLALENMGDIDRQTISGAISTGTHGTGLAFGGLATQVAGLTLVSGNGEVIRIDDEHNPELLPAARIGLGALGIITEVTLRCVPGFAIHAVEKPEPLAPVLDNLDERVTSADHFEFYWFPHTATALTKSNTRMPGETATRGAGRLSKRITEEVVENGALGALCVIGTALPSVIPALNNAAVRLMGERVHVQQSNRVFATQRRIRFREMEYAIPYEALPEAFAEVRRLIDRRGWRIGLPIEVRMSAADDNWLSTAYGRATAYLAFHRYFREDPSDYFAAMETVMVGHGGRPHWGKMHNRTAADLRAGYPRFDDFVALRERLDPERTFDNDYLRSVLGE